MEPWTAMYAQVVLGTFQLSTKGETRLNEALGKLKSFGSAGDLMYFGFGVKHIVRTLAESREGMTTVAICAAMAEIHGSWMSAFIVQEYAKLYSAGAPGNLVPSYRQWEALVKSCSGVLSQSPFGLVFEFFKRLNPQRGGPKDFCGEPKHVADALDGLAKISNGLMKSMVLKGNSECGFLAATAQWLFDLRVVVQNSSGNIVYPSTGADVDTYQLMIIYCDDIGTSETVSRVGGAYYIKHPHEIFAPDSLNYVFLSGRVEWATALRDTFGSSANKLLQVPTILGDLFGGAAKINSLAPWNSNSPWIFTRFGPEASGRAFIDLACRTLPELLVSRDWMGKALERPDDQANLNFEKSSALLKEVCGCTTCQASPAAFDTDYLSPCLWLLAHTAIQLVRLVSAIASIPADLRPSRRGLEVLYSRVRMPNCVPQETNLPNLLDQTHLLDLASILFGVGVQSIYEEGKHDMSAVSSGGLCSVLESVLKLSVKAEKALRIHIIPGHIEWDGKIYEKVRDRDVFDREPENVIPPMILPVATARLEAHMQLIANMTTQAVVSESFDGLRMSYEIRSTSGYLNIGPRDICDQIARTSTTVSCSAKVCPSFNRLQEDFLLTMCDKRLPYASGRGMIPSDVHSKPNIMLFGENQVARCVALMQSRLSPHKVLLQDRECIACCARRALMTDKAQQSIIVSHLTVEDVERLMGSPKALVYDA